MNSSKQCQDTCCVCVCVSNAVWCFLCSPTDRDVGGDGDFRWVLQQQVVSRRTHHCEQSSKVFLMVIMKSTELMTGEVLSHKARNKMKITKIEEDKRNFCLPHSSISSSFFFLSWILFYFILHSFASWDFFPYLSDRSLLPELFIIFTSFNSTFASPEAQSFQSYFDFNGPSMWEKDSSD